MKPLTRYAICWGIVWMAAACFEPNSPRDSDHYLGMSFVAFVIFLPWQLNAVVRHLAVKGGIARVAASALDIAILHWTPNDPFTMRDLLNGGICILGRPGSGKTSSSGMRLAEGVIGYPGSGGLILSSSPTDIEMWQDISRRAGRSGDLILFGPKYQHCFNLIDFLAKLGADNREIAKAITTIGEALDNDDSRSGGGESDKFWPMQVKSALETAVTVLMLAEGKMSIPALHNFIITAAQNPAEVKDAVWKAKYHHQCFEKAYYKRNTEMEKDDYKLAMDKWFTQWPGMSEKTRSSIEASLSGILHVFNSGAPRPLLSKDSTITPEVMEQGKWVIVDMSPGQYGSSGAFVNNAWRYGTQFYVKRRGQWRNPIIIWADEAGKLVNSADSFYLTESRKFGGATVFLAQSMQSFHAAMPGERGKSQAEVLLGCFATKVAHAIGDPGTAEWLSKLLGKEVKKRTSISGKQGQQPMGSTFGGQSSGGFSVNTTLEPVLDTKEFMHNLRTGGAVDGYIADGIVIRSGKSFSTGTNHLFVPFKQRH